MKIKIKEVLMWYDGPYLFVSEGESRELFLGIKVRLEGEDVYNFKYLFAETNEKEIGELKQATKSVDSVFSKRVSYIEEFEGSHIEMTIKPYVLDEKLDEVFFDE